MTARVERAAWLAFTAALIAGVGAAFWLPALLATKGVWPAPLDDVYIHFAFARSAALGHPFEWIPGNGYSSGATSVLYPLLLAPGWLLGFRGPWLGVFAALVACASLVDLAASLRALLARAPRWIPWLVPPLLLSIPLLDWSLYSGMETALMGAVLGRSLWAAQRAMTADPVARPRAQVAAGLWCAALFATRPETAALAGPLGCAVVYAAGSLGTLGSLARALGPLALAIAAQAAANRALSGEWGAAGAVRKLLTSNPYATSLEVGAEVIKNLAALRTQAFESALGGPRWSWALYALAGLALLAKETRRLAVPLALGATGTLLLVSLNATARFQNLRYATPSMLMLVAAGALGAGAAARRGAFGKLAAAAALACALLGPLPGFPAQLDHFARSSANIAGQQVEIARRLAGRSPRPRRVLLNDAGAIPYLAEIGAVDGLGLGGYRGLPFARASVHGNAAVLELIERLTGDERPELMVLYPSWWADVVDRFGRAEDRVRIADNVICGADEKVVYAADWRALASPAETRPGAVDTLDVADLVDEREHGYELPGPHAGWAVVAIRRGDAGAPRFDGGRLVPEGRSEAFVLRAGVAPGPATLILRTDGLGAAAIAVSVEREGNPIAREAATVHGGATDEAAEWQEISVGLREVRGGDTIRIRAERGTWRSFHAWVVR